MLRTKKGFTLVELMVVIVIIGILAALAIPKFTNASAKAKMSEAPTVIASYENAQMARAAEVGTLGGMTDLVFDPPQGSKWFDYTDGGTPGQYTATATKDMGDFDVNDWIRTAFDATDVSAAPTHSANDAGASDACRKLIPNFLP